MTTQELGFKAEVQKLLELMIHSVYSDREVFLRELISNSADALDKVRFLGLTRSDLVPSAPGEAHVRITVDSAARTVTIEDDGVGLSQEEAVQNLGTIAHSGTKAFLEAAKVGGGAPDLIGQFGIGFYSVFMVADEVEVVSRSALPGTPGVRWTSKGQGSFVVEEAERDFRGTTIRVTLREDAAEFAEVSRVNAIVRKHSNYLPWPIHVQGEQANTGKALWAETPSQVSAEEANSFYKSLAMDWQDPALRIHVSVDSPIQYSALLFVPTDRPHDLFQPEVDRGPRLYARRVLITEHARDLLPDWLRFLRGVVDSEDIPLNVSREMVQKTPVVRKIRDALVKRVLKALQEASAGEEEAAREKYETIWRSFGALLKEGYYHSPADLREMMLPLLRFNATSHDDGDGQISLKAYVEAMPEGQDTIWFLTGRTRRAALDSPQLEAFRKKGWNVLLLTDPVDEWLTAVLTDFEGKPVRSVARGGVQVDETPDVEKADLQAFAPWLQSLLDGEVAGVRESQRLTDSACVLVDSDDGIGSNLERILRAANQEVPDAKRILELNPHHPLVRDLVALQGSGRVSEAEPLARLLYENARLVDGSLREPAAMGRHVQELLARVAKGAVSGSKTDAADTSAGA